MSASSGGASSGGWVTAVCAAAALAAGAPALAVAPTPLAAQATPDEPPPLVGDRPDFTESARVVTRVQLESGYTLQEGPVDEHSVGEVLVRVPATSWLEVRLSPSSYLVRAEAPSTPSGFEDAAAGVKLRLSKARAGAGRARPGAALLLGSTLATGDASDAGPQPEARLALGWDLTDRLAVGTNVGVGWGDADGDRFAQLISSLAVGVDLGGGLAAYAEGYGMVPGGPAGGDEGYVDGGLTYLLTEDLQLDARVGAGVAGKAEDVIFGAGVVSRF